MTTRPSLLVIVGPTGVGKTALAVYLARHIPMEVVSADSRQVYRWMDIGTAKPTPEEMAVVRHHLVDVTAPDRPISLAEFQQMAYAAIEGILRRGLLPALVGGTGQYVRSIVEGWQAPEVPPNQALRDALYRVAGRIGAGGLYQRLKSLDPEAARRIDPRNLRRTVRALEVILISGRRFSESRRRAPLPYRILQIGLTLPRDELYARVDARVDGMIGAGLVEEVQSLLEMGYSPGLPSMSALGYREIVEYLQGEVDLEEAVQAIKHHTHRLIRQQYTWFRLDDPSIHWFWARESVREEILAFVQSWLAQAN